MRNQNVNICLRMAFTAGGRFPRARLEPPHSPQPLTAGSQDSCCSRDAQDVLVSSVAHRTSPVLADQESPPYVSAIRVRFQNTNICQIYLLNVQIFFQ